MREKILLLGMILSSTTLLGKTITGDCYLKNKVGVCTFYNNTIYKLSCTVTTNAIDNYNRNVTETLKTVVGPKQKGYSYIDIEQPYSNLIQVTGKAKCYSY